MPLTQDEIEGCREAFQSFEQDRGCIEVWDLRQVLEAMGQVITDAELFQVVSEVDDRKAGSIGEALGERGGGCEGAHAPCACVCCCAGRRDAMALERARPLGLAPPACASHGADFGEFLRVIERQKERALKMNDEGDMGERRVRAERSIPSPPARRAPTVPLSSRLSLRTAVDAFVSCGGNADKSGHVERTTLVKIIKHVSGVPWPTAACWR